MDGPTDALAEDDLAEVAASAWVYGYPLLAITTLAEQTTRGRTAGGFQAPYNQIINLRQFPNPTYTAVVAPNVDTLYSSAFLDLSNEPLVLQWPDMGERYFVVPIMDGWSNVVGSYGSRTTGQEGRTLVLAGPGWSGAVPAGGELPGDTIVLRVPTNLAWLAGRISCLGTAADYDAVHALQDQLRLLPLSAFIGTASPPAGQNGIAADLSVLGTPVEAMPADQFFRNLAALMGSNPPLAADAPILSRMAALGIVPGQPFDLSSLPAETQQALLPAPATGLNRIRTQQNLALRTRGAWSYNADTGTYGTDYLLRAVIALIALGANLSADAIYPVATADSAGQPLDGSNRYIVHFASEPPVRGFWSLTAYNGQRHLIPNPIERYAIRSGDPLVTHDDGSFGLSVQTESPGRGREANWLPCGSGSFALYLRCYWPDAAILDGSWPLPIIEQVR